MVIHKFDTPKRILDYLLESLDKNESLTIKGLFYSGKITKKIQQDYIDPKDKKRKSMIASVGEYPAYNNFVMGGLKYFLESTFVEAIKALERTEHFKNLEILLDNNAKNKLKKRLHNIDVCRKGIIEIIDKHEYSQNQEQIEHDFKNDGKKYLRLIQSYLAEIFLVFKHHKLLDYVYKDA